MGYFDLNENFKSLIIKCQQEEKLIKKTSEKENTFFYCGKLTYFKWRDKTFPDSTAQGFFLPPLQYL